MDKSKNLEVDLALVNDKVRLSGFAAGQDPVMIDYIPPLGDNEGYTSMELLLLSLGSCLATSLLLFLRQMSRNISGLQVKVEADRSICHPTVLTSIHLRFYFDSPDLTVADFEKALSLSEEKYCPVYSMITRDTRIVSTCHISQTESIQNN
jgi:putative redox protein